MDLFGIIGNPLGKSQSKEFFNRKFDDEKINARYEAFELPRIESLTEILKNRPDLKGFNVTIPYKEQIIPYLSRISPEAAAVRAVNVVKIVRDEKGTPLLSGYNSDIIGFRQSLEPLLEPHHRKALVLGTGGASKAVAYVLEQKGIDVLFVSRKAGTDRLTYSEVTPRIIQERLLIVNCTPLGMYIDASPLLPYEELTPRHLLYDVVYHPSLTRFMQQGTAYGAKVENGYSMWLAQALASWNIWNS